MQRRGLILSVLALGTAGFGGHVMLLQARATRERAAAPSRAIAAARSRGIV